MNIDEAKSKYESNGGHYFEWFDFFGQKLMRFYLNKNRTFIVKCYSRYTVLGFNEDFTHVLGYGSMEGYASYDEAKNIARNPGAPAW